MQWIVLISLAVLGASLIAASLMVWFAVPFPAGLILFVILQSWLVWFATRLVRALKRPIVHAISWFGLALLLVPSTVGVGALSSAVVNNLRLARFAAQLFTYPLPPGARIVTTSSAVGVLTGNDVHCDFIARMELVANLSVEDLRAYYSTLRLRPAIPGGAVRTAAFQLSR